jgi:hypothetical protein
MTDEDVVARVAVLLGTRYYKCISKNVRHKDSFKLSLRGETAVKMMRFLRPLMGRRRGERIDAAILTYEMRPKPAPGALPKLTGKAAEIRKLHKRGWSLRRLGKRFGVSQVSIFRCVHRRTYK